MAQTATEKVKQQALATQKPLTLEALIQKNIEQLKYALPSGMNAERMARIALTCLRINPKLFEVAGRNPQSFIAALFQSAQLGLEPNTIGEAWLIPYGNEVKFQIGAYGWAKLFYNHESSVDIQMENVHQNDIFDCNLGTKVINHIKPAFGHNRGPVVGYYAQIRLANGGKILKTLSVEEAKEWAIKYSKCWNKEKKDFLAGTPWKSNFDSMGQVTVLKMALKVVPKTAETIKRAFAMDETVKSKVEPDMSAVPNEIDYSKQAESAEEVKAEPSSEPADNPPPPSEPPPVAQGSSEADQKAKYDHYCEAIGKAQSRKDINTIFGHAQASQEKGEISTQHAQWLLDKMKSRTSELKELKKP